MGNAAASLATESPDHGTSTCVASVDGDGSLLLEIMHGDALLYVSVPVAVTFLRRRLGGQCPGVDTAEVCWADAAEQGAHTRSDTLAVVHELRASGVVPSDEVLLALWREHEGAWLVWDALCWADVDGD